jgi:BASS family bile acid:Na+ symporter
MQQNALTGVVLPIALAVIMLGLGLSLEVADFRRAVAARRAVGIGLVCQTMILPLVCLALAHAFGLPPELSVGLMLLAASPGGATANLFSHLAGGDVALNVTLTAVNSVLSIFTLPLIVNWSFAHFFGEGREIPLQFTKIIQVFAVVLGPIAIGMIVRARRIDLAKRLDRPVRLLSALFLVAVVAGAIAAERANVAQHFRAVGLAALCFNLASIGLGYLVPRVVGVGERQSIAIGMEIGIHNATLAITIASSPRFLGSPAMAVPPAVYGLVMFATATVFGALASRRLARLAPASIG